MNGKIKNSIKKNFLESLCNQCITILIESYKLAIEECKYNDNWEEDDYTALLVDDYMNKVPLKYNARWHIAPQRPNYTEKHLNGTEHAKKAPRPDIRFEKYVLSEPIPFQFTIEAKIVKAGSSDLKRRYITTGIENFTTKRYPNGCLAAYVINSKTNDCVKGINRLLKKDKREKEILKNNNIIDGFKNSFISNHSLDKGTIGLIHVFLEF